MRELAWWVEDHKRASLAVALVTLAAALAVLLAPGEGSKHGPEPASKLADRPAGRSPEAQPRSKPGGLAPAAPTAPRRRREQGHPTARHRATTDPAPRRAPAKRTAAKRATAIAAAHPGVSCPASVSYAACVQVVEAPAGTTPAPHPISKPSECVKAMSREECEALFQAEEKAAAAAGAPFPAEECMQHPELEQCAALVEEMKKQYTAEHPTGE